MKAADQPIFDAVLTYLRTAGLLFNENNFIPRIYNCTYKSIRCPKCL